MWPSATKVARSVVFLCLLCCVLGTPVSPAKTDAPIEMGDRLVWGKEPSIRHQTWNWVTGSPGQWVIWVNFHVRVTGVRPEFFRFSKNAQMQKIQLKCWNDKSHCQVSVVGLKSLDVSPCNELLLLPMIIKNSLAWEYFFTRKSIFGVH